MDPSEEDLASFLPATKPAYPFTGRDFTLQRFCLETFIKSRLGSNLEKLQAQLANYQSAIDETRNQLIASEYDRLVNFSSTVHELEGLISPVAAPMRDLSQRINETHSEMEKLIAETDKLLLERQNIHQSKLVLKQFIETKQRSQEMEQGGDKPDS